MFILNPVLQKDGFDRFCVSCMWCDMHKPLRLQVWRLVWKKNHYHGVGYTGVVIWKSIHFYRLLVTCCAKHELLLHVFLLIILSSALVNRFKYKHYFQITSVKWL